MPFFDGAAGRVYYRHWSTSATDGPRAAVIFLHGFGEHTGLYHRYAAALGVHGIDVWAVDEVGHGLSPGERGQFGSIENLLANARTLTEITQAESPGVPLVVAGHSIGSLVAVLAALDHPETYAAAVVSGAPFSAPPWLAEAERSGGTLDLDPAELSSDPFYLDQLETDPLAFTSADVVEILAAHLPPVWSRIEQELAAFPVPLLAVHGEQDPIAPLPGVAAWSDRLPGLQIEVIPDAGHDVLNEVAHAQVADRVAEFVLTSAPAPGEVRS